ncbi:MAG: hypothetical protein K8R02_02805 [Anaerohalosphaeraceae bacterium]|nr:hypothetical protein [Anaerohalosphaeraceae bacterium]
MTEVYPTDNELLNIVSDSHSGVEYITTGKSPYYLEFRKMLYRLLLTAKRAGDMRVFDESGLDVGVKSGKFWIGSELIEFAESTGNTLADDKENIYLYIDVDGNLVTDEYDDFPDMSTEAHMRLAIATTSSGDVTSITDVREHHNFSVPFSAGGIRKVIEAHTTDDTLTLAESESIHSNLGASGTVTLTLPAAATAGTEFTFAVQAAQELRIEPGTATIRDDSGQTVGKYKSAQQIGECIRLVADSNGDWATTAKNGTWTEEA